MARFAFICLPFRGHVAPLAAVGQELVERGHRVTFVHHAEVAPLLRSFGLDVTPIAATAADAGRLTIAMERVGHVRGVVGARPVMRDFAATTDMLCEALPAALRSLGVDCIVSDWFEAAGGLVARHLGLPYVSIAAALPMNWSPGDASPFLGWSYRTGRSYRYANIAAQWGAERFQRPIQDAIRRYASKWGLAAHRRIEDWASGYAQITQLTASLDFPRQRLIGCFHYCGPLRPRAAVATPPSPRSDRRRAFASLGSLQGHRARLFEWIADAAQAVDLELTIAHGGRLTTVEAERLSRRASVHAFVDYAAVLRETDVAIMHAGMNGVLDALAQGVPLVLVPLAYEQGAIAARVRRAGAGVVCRPLARGGRLEAALRAALDAPSHAAAAARMKEDIAAAGGRSLAADIIEQVARTRQPCLNAAAAAAEPGLARFALGAA